jgi:serine/threonine protein kinase
MKSIRVLGRGAFGTVKLAVDPRSGTQVRVMAILLDAIVRSR